VTYLAQLITGETSRELDGRSVERVSFQQAPVHPVDDLVITASRDGGIDPLTLEVAVRRAPAFITSDQDTEHLIGKLLASKRLASVGNADRRLVICVAGPLRAAREVEQLAELARQQASAEGLFTLIRTPGRFSKSVRDRLQHLVGLVNANLSRDGEDTPIEAVEAATWQLLGHLHILMPRLETPDESDWSDLLNRLEPWSREQTKAGAAALRDRLESLAASYAPAAADVALAILRRDAHEVLHLERRRRAVAWRELLRLDADARSAVSSALGVGAVAAPVQLPRSTLAAKLRSELSPAYGVLVSGESGIGKSALVLGELARVASSDPAQYGVVCLNLRLLPPTMAELRSALGAPLEDLLAEISAPTRVLAIDAADATLERSDQLLGQLLRAARTACLVPWVVSATDGRAAVHAVMQQDAGPFRELSISGLEDAELEQVAKAFPQLRRLLDEPRAKALLRRPAVLDLFVRSGGQGLPLSDADAFDIVWMQLIRKGERTHWGFPDARDHVMRQLAANQLRQSDAPTTYSSLDPAAVAGLQHDGLLRPVDRWNSLPTFAHELLRTYAVARVLLSSTQPVDALIASGVPRWSLPAARLAVQVQLSAPDTLETPVTGRLVRLQTAIDRLPAAGHGDRWADLPAEAVLTLPTAHQVLNDAWADLNHGDGSGLRRLLRVIQQRHGRSGLVERFVAEPLATLLLVHGFPSKLRDDVNELLRGWLRGLVVAGEPNGHPLRRVLREKLAAHVAAGDRSLADSRRLEEERLAARTPEQIAKDEERARAAFSIGSLGRRRRRAQRPDVPHELIEDEQLEQLALLGADLGEEGEALLRRVASDAPHHLAPAVERLLTGHSLAFHDARLLGELVEAYYIDDDDEDGYDGIARDGIRDHQYGGLGAPMAAFYRGPFLALLRADLRGGVACLNRLLNHAARARARTLGSFGHHGSPELADRFSVELDVAGERRPFFGDEHVWMWYRGTGVGPNPCMSALQALELVCDEYIRAGAPIDRLVRLMLHSCENLAMPALVVGLLVRHLEDAGTAIDPFLAEPVIWRLEFVRAVHEHSVFSARTEGIAAPERRTWTLREAAMWLTLSADDDRGKSLEIVGRRLVERATELEGGKAEGEPMTEELAAVYGWAASFDRRSFRFSRTGEGVLVEQIPHEQVVARLAASNTDLARGQEATRLIFRYGDRFEHIAKRTPVTIDELVTDIVTARSLVSDPPKAAPGRPYDAPAAVAATALEAKFRLGWGVPDDDLVWAAGLLVALLNVLAERNVSEEDYSVFGRGADRSAARGLPMLWLPGASYLNARLAAEEELDAGALARAAGWLIDKGANESRLFLARGFDELWNTSCGAAGDECHHVAALRIIEDIARDCLIGPWDPNLQRRGRLHIDGPVAPQLREAERDRVLVPRLSAAIRGASAAAVSGACCHAAALQLLEALLTAHRQGMHECESGYFHSADDAAVAARAVLELAAVGRDELLTAFIDDYAPNPRLLSEFLRALVAAGEETQLRAAALTRLWPSVIERVVGLVVSGACPTDDHHYGRAPLAAVIPTPSYESGYLHREYEGEPILWADPVALAPQIQRWLTLAAGHREPLDALVQLIERVPLERQPEVGLPWIERLVMDKPKGIANRSFLLPGWLERIRPHVAAQPLLSAWHRIVDALTVAGDDRAAALAD
jgi:hypothetical protein